MCVPKRRLDVSLSDPAMREWLLVLSHTSHGSPELRQRGLIAVLLRNHVSKRLMWRTAQRFWHVSYASFVWILLYFPKRQGTLLIVGPLSSPFKIQFSQVEPIIGLVQHVARSGCSLPSFKVFSISELPTSSSIIYGFLSRQGEHLDRQCNI